MSPYWHNSLRRAVEMITKLTVGEILTMLSQVPEQHVFDWKRDLSLDNDDKKSEFVKDIAAIANGTTNAPGFIFYGVDADRSGVVPGMSHSYDDANLQQLVSGKITPDVDFLYYEILENGKTIGVVHIPPSRKCPHIIARDFGRLREGQVLVRQGSSTRGIHLQDLFGIFYGQSSPYLGGILEIYGVAAKQRELDLQQAKQLSETISDIIARTERSIERRMR